LLLNLFSAFVRVSVKFAHLVTSECIRLPVTSRDMIGLLTFICSE